jgi:hypothetical protein
MAGGSRSAWSCRYCRGRRCRTLVVRARELRAALERHGTAAGVARAFGITRASVCQYLTILRRLPPEVLAEVEGETDPATLKRFTLGRLLNLSTVSTVGARRRRAGRTASER